MQPAIRSHPGAGHRGREWAIAAAAAHHCQGQSHRLRCADCGILRITPADIILFSALEMIRPIFRSCIRLRFLSHVVRPELRHISQMYLEVQSLTDWTGLNLRLRTSPFLSLTNQSHYTHSHGVFTFLRCLVVSRCCPPRQLVPHSHVDMPACLGPRATDVRTPRLSAHPPIRTTLCCRRGCR